jgi:hypothetical protein
LKLLLLTVNVMRRLPVWFTHILLAAHVSACKLA